MIGANTDGTLNVVGWDKTVPGAEEAEKEYRLTQLKGKLSKLKEKPPKPKA